MSDEAIPRYRRPTREMAPLPTADSHVVWCWEGAGPGARLRLHVDQVEQNMSQQIDGVAKESRKDITAINKRLWYISGGAAVVGLLAPLVLGIWLNSQFKGSNDRAVKRADVEQAIKRSADMATAKAFDDAGLFKQMLDKAAVTVPMLPELMQGKARK